MLLHEVLIFMMLGLMFTSAFCPQMEKETWTRDKGQGEGDRR